MVLGANLQDWSSKTKFVVRVAAGILSRKFLRLWYLSLSPAPKRLSIRIDLSRFPRSGAEQKLKY